MTTSRLHLQRETLRPLHEPAAQTVPGAGKVASFMVCSCFSCVSGVIS